LGAWHERAGSLAWRSGYSGPGYGEEVALAVALAGGL
jgi:hypothetical protein